MSVQGLILLIFLLLRANLQTCPKAIKNVKTEIILHYEFKTLHPVIFEQLPHIVDH